jgi:predicted adenine nucleotide alpha hydrolase (AANH) superfamily ATPase
MMGGFLIDLSRVISYSNSMPKLLLQACCAPCVAYPIEILSGEHTLGLFYYNPNIQPAEEYQKRLNELKKHADRLGLELIEGNYDIEKWLEAIKGLEDEPERGHRCDKCFELRLRATAIKAKELGFEMFGTGLTTSPYKKADRVNAIGEQIAQETGVKYYEADFKKNDGAHRAVELSKQYKFYRQNYCGCVFSKPASEKKSTT